MPNKIKAGYRFGPFCLTPAERLLLRGETPVPLTPKAFDTLVLLVERHGSLVTKEELLSEVWPGTAVEEGSVAVVVSGLRKVLGDKGYIETVPKQGYRFIAEVEQENFQGAEDSDRTAEVMPARNAPEAPSRRHTLAAVVLVAALAVEAGLLYHRTHKPQSIAVLPFRELGAQTPDEGLSIGIADAIITKLASTRDFRVIPASSVARYADPKRDPRDIGRDLRATAVLQGHFQRDGTRMRVNVQAIRVGDGSSLWADTFEIPFTGIFALEDTIAERTSRAFSITPTAEQRSRIQKRYTNSATAYELYLKGRHFWSKRTEEALRKGIEQFGEAVKEDPNYAQAYSALADSWAVLMSYTTRNPMEDYQEARAAAAKALELDPMLPEAHAAVGIIRLFFEWDWPQAGQELQRAITLDPENATARQWSGLVFTVQGRFAEAHARFRQARELEPLSMIIQANMGWALCLDGRYADAEQVLRKALDLDPRHYRTRFRLGQVLEEKKMYRDAIAEYERAMRDAGGDTYAEARRGHALALAGQSAEARRVLAALQETAKRQYVNPVGLAALAGVIGEKDAAFAHLERACELRSPSAMFLKHDPVMAPLRGDPRFQTLLQKYKL